MSDKTSAQSIVVSCPKCDGVSNYSDWIPLAQTVLWVLLIAIAVWWFKDQIKAIVAAIEHRVRTGSAVKAGPLEIGEDLKVLDRVRPSNGPASGAEDDWGGERTRVYSANHGLFLAHILSPSSEPGQLYDVFIFLVRHKSDTFEDVLHAEFFLGPYWGNEIYKETLKNGLLGISTTADGPFLCICRITLKSGEVVHTYRYIDFEMGRIYQKNES